MEGVMLDVDLGHCAVGDTDAAMIQRVVDCRPVSVVVARISDTSATAARTSDGTLIIVYMPE
jgi:Mrp family chromosome partitioning ATPase